MKGEFRAADDGKVIRYRVPIRDVSAIVEILGEIRKKNDGRYTWYRSASKYFPNWISEIDGKITQGVEVSISEIDGKITQGVEVSIELAKLRMLEGWKHGE